MHIGTIYVAVNYMDRFLSRKSCDRLNFRYESLSRERDRLSDVESIETGCWRSALFSWLRKSRNRIPSRHKTLPDSRKAYSYVFSLCSVEIEKMLFVAFLAASFDLATIRNQPIFE